jgi:hypothetical protein
MIIYDLSCRLGHRFEGWFANAGDFERQLTAGLVLCPQCNSHDIRRIPSVVALAGLKGPTGREAARVASAVLPQSGTEIIAAYRQFVNALMENSEDVGNSFATEARKIHYNEVPQRAIRGNATSEEFAELAEEGVPVVRLPIIGEEELN